MELEQSLPPYELTPTVTPVKIGYRDLKYPLLVETNLEQRQVDSGDFLTGTVNVVALDTVDEPLDLSLTIWNKIATFKCKNKFLSKKNTLLTRKISKLNRSMIPIKQRLEAGYSYTFPFSIKFPDTSDFPKCPCNQSIHSPSLPSAVNSCHVHIEYYLTSIIRGYSKRCWQQFLFAPSSTTLNLSNFYDVQGRKLMRKHTSGYCPSMTASCWPVFHRTGQGAGSVIVDIKCRSGVSLIKTTVTKHTYTNPEGMGNVIRGLDDIKIESTQLSTGLVAGGCQPGTCSIEIPYEVPIDNSEIVPSLVGCFTAVLYSLKIEFSTHNDDVCILTTPLLINNEDPLPDYSEIFNHREEKQLFVPVHA